VLASFSDKFFPYTHECQPLSVLKTPSPAKIVIFIPWNLRKSDKINFSQRHGDLLLGLVPVSRRLECINGCKRVAPSPFSAAWPGSMLETHILRPHSRLSRSENPGMGLSKLLPQVLKSFSCILKSEGHHSGLTVQAWVAHTPTSLSVVWWLQQENQKETRNADSRTDE
jgi:hypothetical protein